MGGGRGHVLKILYSFLCAGHRAGRFRSSPAEGGNDTLKRRRSCRKTSSDFLLIKWKKNGGGGQHTCALYVLKAGVLLFKGAFRAVFLSCLFCLL